MAGLYRKALTFHQLTLQESETSAAPRGRGDDGISDEERAKISSQIEGILAENRIQMSPEALGYTAKRRGAFLPVMSNVAIFAVFVIVGVIVFRLLNHQEQFIASGQATVQGTENKLIAAMKKETEQQLKTRDQAILDAQKKLQAASQQEQQLRDQASSAIKAKEDALRADFDAKLAQERARLSNQGLSAAAQSQQLREFQAARQREIDAQLAAAKRQSDAEVAAREKSLAVQVSQYQNDLDSARQQRMQIQADYAQRESSLRTQYAQSLQNAESARAAVGEELARLRAQREKEQLVLDQILAGYTRVNSALQQQDLAAAQKGLDSLRAYLDDPSVVTLPTIQKRRGVELFLIDSLQDLVRARASSATSSQQASVAEASAQLRAVSDLVTRGDALVKAGDLSGARDAYLKAIQVIPSVGRGYTALDEMRSKATAADLQKANLFYQAGNFQGSLSQYRQAVGVLLGDSALANQLTDNIMDAGYRVLAADDLAALARLRNSEQRRQAILRRLQDLRSQYVAYAALPQKASGGTAGDQSLASLLQAKVLLRQILGSDPIRTQYPNLDADIGRYFDALERQGKAEGRKEAFDQMASVLDGIAGAGSLPRLAVGSDASGTDGLVSLLDRLQQLLAGK